MKICPPPQKKKLGLKKSILEGKLRLRRFRTAAERKGDRIPGKRKQLV